MYAYPAAMFPSKKIGADIAKAKTVVVSCGFQDLDKSAYGRCESGTAEQLRGIEWSHNTLSEHQSVFM